MAPFNVENVLYGDGKSVPDTSSGGVFGAHDNPFSGEQHPFTELHNPFANPQNPIAGPKGADAGVNVGVEANGSKPPLPLDKSDHLEIPVDNSLFETVCKVGYGGLPEKLSAVAGGSVAAMASYVPVIQGLGEIEVGASKILLPKVASLAVGVVVGAGILYLLDDAMKRNCPPGTYKAFP